MNKTLTRSGLLLSGLLLALSVVAQLPPGFEYCKRIIPTLHTELKYATGDNFTNQKLPGYNESVCVLTYSALNQLFKIQNKLSELGLGLKVFDGYRPQKAVDAFLAWKSEPDLPEVKHRFYPDLEKETLFKEQYIARYSGHTRGSTVDLTLIDLTTRQELDLGTEFDFFGEQANPLSQKVSPQQRANRLLLRTIMMEHGFLPYKNEWWHFTLANEPFPNTYFDFDIQ